MPWKISFNIFIKLNFFWIIGVKSYIVVVVEDFVFILTFHIKVFLLNFLDFFSGIYFIKEFVFRFHKMNWNLHLFKFLVFWHRRIISNDCSRTFVKMVKGVQGLG